MGASDIKAGGAYVELRAPPGALDKDLQDAEKRVSQYSQNVRQIDRSLRTADSPQAKQDLQRARAGQAERLGTAQQEAEGRRALAERLKVFKATRDAEKTATEQQETDRQKGLANQHRQIKESWKAQVQALEQQQAVAREKLAGQKEIDDALFNATASARDKALRDNDAYWDKMAKKAGNDPYRLGQIQGAREAGRKKIIEASPKEVAAGGDKGKNGLLEAILGREGIAKINAISGGLGVAAMAVAGFKAALVGTEAVVDRMDYGLYQAAGQIDKCAQISQKWVDKLSALPLVGQYFSLLFKDVSMQNQQIIADFEKMRQLSEKAWAQMPAEKLHLKTTLMSPLEARQPQIDAQYKASLEEAAALDEKAKEIRTQVRQKYREDVAGGVAGELGPVGIDLISQDEFDQKVQERLDNLPESTDAKTAENLAGDKRRRAEEQKRADEEKLRRDREILHTNQQFDVDRAHLAATDLGKPWEEGPARQVKELELDQQQETANLKYDNDVDKNKAHEKQIADKAALAKKFTDEETMASEDASRRRMTAAEQEADDISKLYDRRRAGLGQLIQLETDPARKQAMQGRLAGLYAEERAEKRLVEAAGRRALAQEAYERQRGIREDIAATMTARLNKDRYIIPGSFERAKQEAKQQADLFRDQRRNEIENSDKYAPKSSDTQQILAEKAAKKQEALDAMEAHAKEIEAGAAESFRDQVHGWEESIKRPGERISDFRSRLDEAQNAGVLTDELRAKIQKRMGYILGLDTSTTGTFSSQLQGMAAAPARTLAEIAQATAETARNTRRFANGTLRLG